MKFRIWKVFDFFNHPEWKLKLSFLFLWLFIKVFYIYSVTRNLSGLHNNGWIFNNLYLNLHLNCSLKTRILQEYSLRKIQVSGTILLKKKCEVKSLTNIALWLWKNLFHGKQGVNCYGEMLIAWKNRALINFMLVTYGRVRVLCMLR